MLRVRDTAVVRKSGALMYRDAPFRGVLYQARSKGVYQPVMVVDGAIDPQATDRGEGFATDLRDLTGGAYDSATGDAKHILVDSQPFTGFCCEFSGDFCTREFESAAGNIVADRWWNKEGMLLRLIDNKEIQRDYQWGPDGILRRGMVGVRGKSSAMVGYSDEGRLSSLILRGAGVWAIDAKHLPLLDAGATANMTVDRKLALTGDQITDEVVERIRPAMLAANLSEISLRETALSAVGIASVMSNPSLVAMRVEASGSEQERAVRAEMKHRPDLRVEMRSR